MHCNTPAFQQSETTMKIEHLAAAVTLALSINGSAWAAGAPTKSANGLLVGTNGMTLYTFDKDGTGSGKSACNGPCASNWPPLSAAGSETASGDYSIVTRDDGSKQWALRGKPLYFWSKDQQPGDKTGDGFNGVWQAAKP
jgi:predicted lipoprotein with Yx(FWY)xxD motif